MVKKGKLRRSLNPKDTGKDLTTPTELMEWGGRGSIAGSPNCKWVKKKGKREKGL